MVTAAVVVEFADGSGPPRFGGAQMASLVLGTVLLGGAAALFLETAGTIRTFQPRLVAAAAGGAGIVLLALGLLADVAGGAGYTGLGWKQATAVGLGAAAVGMSTTLAWLSLRAEQATPDHGTGRKASWRHWYPTVRAIADKHRGLVVLLGLAALIRVAVSVAHWPVLFFSDSSDYVGMTTSGSPVGFSTSGHPSGYPLVLEIVSGGLSSLGAIAIFQHIVGLITGTLAYALVLRLRAPRWAALVAAALVLLDAHLLAFEQHVATESLFVLLLVAVCFLLVGRVTVSRAAVTGLLLAFATTMRTAALFAAPVWLLYLALDRNRLRVVGPALAAFVAPMLVYAALHGQATGWYGLGESGGWLLYGRTAEIADCSYARVPPSTRPLCGAAQRRPLDNPLSYVWTDDSPPRKLFGPLWEGSTARRQRINEDLQSFALAAIRGNPGAYANMVLSDAVDVVLRPGLAVTPPAALPDRNWGQFGVADLRESHFPDYRPPSRFPAGLLLAYQRWAYVPGLLVAALTSIALVVAATNLFRRRHSQEARAILFLAGVGLAIFIGSVATSNSDTRYLLTSIPLLVVAGTAASADLGRFVRRQVRRALERRAPSRIAPGISDR